MDVDQFPKPCELFAVCARHVSSPIPRPISSACRPARLFLSARRARPSSDSTASTVVSSTAAVFDIAEPVIVRQHQGGPLPFRQFVDCGLHLCGDAGLRCPCFRIRRTVCQRHVVYVVSRLRLAQPVNAGVVGNPPEPGIDLRPWLPFSRLAPQLEKGFLRHVLGLMVIAQHPPGEAVNRREVAGDRLAAGARLAAGNAPHQLRIPAGSAIAQVRPATREHRLSWPGLYPAVGCHKALPSHPSHPSPPSPLSGPVPRPNPADGRESPSAGSARSLPCPAPYLAGFRPSGDAACRSGRHDPCQSAALPLSRSRRRHSGPGAGT